MIIIIIFITLLVDLLHYQSIITLPVDLLHYRSIITLPVDLLHYWSIITLLVVTFVSFQIHFAKIKAYLISTVTC